MKDIQIKKLPESEVEFEGELSLESLEKHRAASVKALGAETNIPGFRKGHAPESILKERLGEMPLMTEMAERALSEAYPNILASNGIDAIGRPEVRLTKLAPGNPVGYKVKVAVMPSVTLPEYKKAAAAIMKEAPPADELSVSPADVDTVVLEVRKRLTASKSEDGTAPEELPDLTDEGAKELGDFKDVADLREKVTENLTKEKEQRLKEKKRLKIMQELVAAAKIDVPRVLADTELDRMFAQFKIDMSRMGLKPESYLEHIKKTEADLRTEWLSDAKDRVAAQLLVGEMATAENIVPTDEEISHEAAHLKTHYPDISEAQVRSYVVSALTHEKVFQFLESQK